MRPSPVSKPKSRPATQTRSRQTRDKLMRALENLLRTNDFDEISVAALAEEAGVAVGTVYRRFENKEALIPLLFELWQERSREQYAHAELEIETVLGSDLRGLLRQQMRAAYRFVKQQAHILRAVHLQGRRRPELVGDEWKRVWEETRGANRAFLDLVKDRIARTNLDQAAEMMIYLANTALIEKALFEDDGAGFVLSYDGDDLANEVADVVYGYLMLSTDVD